MKAGVSFLLLFLGVFLYSQSTEKIDVEFDEFENPIVYYTLESGKSVYQIAKLYHAPVDLVLSYNNLNKADEIPVGTKVKIPVDFDYIFRGASVSGYKTTTFIPLVYTIKPKDNLFRISKVYCGESIEDMMNRNGLKSKDLNIGQELILGWLALDSKSVKYYSNFSKEEELPQPTLVRVKNDEDYVVMRKEDDVDLEFSDDDVSDSFDKTDSLMVAPELIQESGVAIWSKTSKGHSMYALHPTAKINSEIELVNPIVNRSVRAKVIGRIPEGAYTNDVSVIISPATAVSLGALDNRFKVVMKYSE